jgi:hypothetical protein
MQTSCLTDLGDTAEGVVENALKSRSFDYVVIGAGLREPKPRLSVVRENHQSRSRLPPDAKIGFNTNPSDKLEAVHPWVTS